MKKKILRGLGVRFVLAVLLFGFCYAVATQQFPQSELLKNQMNYYMTHNSDIHTIAKNTVENAKVLFETVSSKVIIHDKDM